MTEKLSLVALIFGVLTGGFQLSLLASVIVRGGKVTGLWGLCSALFLSAWVLLR